MKQFKSTGFLFVLVAAVVIYAYFFEYRGNQSKKESEEKSKIIITDSLDKVTGFTIINHDGKYVYKKTVTSSDPKSIPRWELVEPIKDIANTAVVQSFLSQFGSEKYIEVVADGSKEKIDYSIYGLDSASGKDKTSQITLQFPEKSLKIEVGTAAGLAGRRYIRINDQEKVLLANYTWEFQLNKNANEFREKSLIPSNTDISSFTIHNSKGTLHFVNDNGKWVLAELKTQDPDPKAIEDIHNQILGLRASDIVSDNKNERVLRASGLMPPSLEITLLDKNKLETKISFGKNKENKIFAIVNSRACVFSVAEDVFKNDGEKTVEDFRDKRKPLAFELVKANEVDFKSDITSFRIKKENNAWQLVEPNPLKTVNSVKVNDLLNKLSTLKVKKYFDQGISYQKSGMETLTIKGEHETLLNLAWSPKAEKDVFVAKSQLTDKTFGLDTKDVESLPFKEVISDKKIEGKK